MGLLAPDDWSAEWLNDGKTNPPTDAEFYRDDPTPLFRKEFSVARKISRARLHISGLGYYEASLNGQRVGDRVLDPGWTRYSERVLYSTYDVTEQLRRGQNCLGVVLGNGWFNPLPLRLWGRVNLRERIPVGRPRFIARLELEFADGTHDAVVSDLSWKVGEGPVRFNSIYLGEIYDARREVAGWSEPGLDDSTWRSPGIATESLGPLRAQTQPPIRVTKTLKPVKLTEPQPGVFIFDLGQNFAGWVNLKLSAPVATKVVLRYGELLNPDGTLNPLTSVAGQIKGTRKNKDGREESIGGPGAPPVAWQSDTYIANGQGVECYTPRFTFHAFRYVEVTGLTRRPKLSDLVGLRLNSDVERVGSFACSDAHLNRIQQMCDWTFLSNLFSVQSDCPHRERFGYGGDIAVTSEALMMNYDMADLYAKTVRDWQESALPDGMLTDTAPTVGIQYCGIGWAMVHPLLLRQLHQYYGEHRLLAAQYEVAKRWLELEVQKHPQFIVGNGLSDHEGLEPTPAPAMVTPLFARSAELVSELAAILGREDDVRKYVQLAADIRDAYGAKFLDLTNGKVGPGTQASQAFALHLGMLPKSQRAAAFRFLLDDIERRAGQLCRW
jgi:alpha-L-rhamnosidase